MGRMLPMLLLWLVYMWLRSDMLSLQQVFFD
jgi:hypothetical protein